MPVQVTPLSQLMESLLLTHRNPGNCCKPLQPGPAQKILMEKSFSNPQSIYVPFAEVMFARKLKSAKGWELAALYVYFLESEALALIVGSLILSTLAH
jgi:hypothetical protein